METPPRPDDMEKKGRREGKGKMQAWGGGYTGDRARGRGGGDRYSPSWSAHPRRASGTEAAT